MRRYPRRAPGFRPAPERRCEDGFPRFTNEVQHQLKVVPWELNTARSPLKSGVKWPVFAPRVTASIHHPVRPSHGHSDSLCQSVNELPNIYNSERSRGIQTRHRQSQRHSDIKALRQAALLLANHDLTGVSRSWTKPRDVGHTSVETCILELVRGPRGNGSRVDRRCAFDLSLDHEQITRTDETGNAAGVEVMRCT